MVRYIASYMSKVTKFLSEDFKTIRNSLVAQASEPLYDLIKSEPDTDGPFDWMRVSFLRTTGINYRLWQQIKQLQSLIEDYKAVI